MTPNLGIAITLASLSSFAFAAGSTVQGSAVGRHVGVNELKQSLRAADMWTLVRAPRWLVGLMLAGLGSLLNMSGLLFGPVSLVQPIGVLAVPWSVILAATVLKRRISRSGWIAAAATLLGTVGFTTMIATNTTTSVPLEQWRIIVACVVVWAGAEGLGSLGRRGPHRWRSLAWSLGGAFYYGLEASLIKSLSDLSTQIDSWHSPLFWAMAPAVVFGAVRAAWMIQQAYATGPSEAVVGAMTVTNPVIAVAFGLIVLQEGTMLLSWGSLWMAISGAIAIGGVILLSQSDAHAAVARGSQPAPDIPQE